MKPLICIIVLVATVFLTPASVASPDSQAMEERCVQRKSRCADRVIDNNDSCNNRCERKSDPESCEDKCSERNSSGHDTCEKSYSSCMDEAAEQDASDFAKDADIDCFGCTKDQDPWADFMKGARTPYSPR